jgi:hypothetical protein
MAETTKTTSNRLMYGYTKPDQYAPAERPRERRQTFIIPTCHQASVIDLKRRIALLLSTNTSILPLFSVFCKDHKNG